MNIGNRSLRNIKKIVAHSILHRPVMEYRSKVAALRIRKTEIRTGGDTTYIVSPYKTGTTYIVSLWDNRISKHEPLQLYSLRDMNDDFVSNFRKRELLLDLKLECSGFLSLFLDELPKAVVRYKYIYVLRSPSKWVESVIKHFYGLRSIGYNYINEYYWKRLLCYNMLPVLNRGNSREIQTLVDDLYKVYFELLFRAEKRSDVYFVELANLDQFAIRMGERIGTEPNFSKAWRREARYTPHFRIPLDPGRDVEYAHFLEQLPQNRLFPLGSTYSDSKHQR